MRSGTRNNATQHRPNAARQRATATTALKCGAKKSDTNLKLALSPAILVANTDEPLARPHSRDPAPTTRHVDKIRTRKTHTIVARHSPSRSIDTRQRNALLHATRQQRANQPTASAFQPLATRDTAAIHQAKFCNIEIFFVCCYHYFFLFRAPTTPSEDQLFLLLFSRDHRTQNRSSHHAEFDSEHGNHQNKTMKPKKNRRQRNNTARFFLLFARRASSAPTCPKPTSKRDNSTTTHRTHPMPTHTNSPQAWREHFLIFFLS